MWFVYLIKSRKAKWYYVGSTNSIERRLHEHNTGKTISTKSHKPFDVVYQREFSTETEARKFEKEIKTNRILKEGIINNL